MHNYFVFVNQTLVAVLSVLVAAFYFDKMPFRTHRMAPTFVNANSPFQLKASLVTISIPIIFLVQGVTSHSKSHTQDIAAFLAYVHQL